MRLLLELQKNPNRMKNPNQNSWILEQWLLPNEGLLLRGCSRAQEAERGRSLLSLHPTRLSAAPPAGEPTGSPGKGYLELRDSNLTTGAGAPVSSSHHFCFGYVVQPPWDLRRSLERPLRAACSFTERVLPDARHVLGCGGRAVNEAVLARGVNGKRGRRSPDSHLGWRAESFVLLGCLHCRTACK